MTVIIPMIVLAQATETATDHVPPRTKPVVADADSTNGDNNVEAGTLVQALPTTKPAIPTEVDLEIQSRFNQLRRELLDDRANAIDWWLAANALVLTFFAIVIAVAGYFGYRRFEEIRREAEAHVKATEGYVEKTREHQQYAAQIVEDMNAETAADNPDEARRAIEGVQNNPEASIIDRAIVEAVNFQRRGEAAKAIEKWRSIANVAEGVDDQLSARAWLSVGFLHQRVRIEGDETENTRQALIACDEALRLRPDYPEAYYNRGIVKQALDRSDEAIADYNEAIRLKPDYPEAYNNRGIAKRAQGRPDEALADYNEALRLRPDYPEAYYNRGIVKQALRNLSTTLRH